MAVEMEHFGFMFVGDLLFKAMITPLALFQISSILDMGGMSSMEGIVLHIILSFAGISFMLISLVQFYFVWRLRKRTMG